MYLGLSGHSAVIFHVFYVLLTVCVVVFFQCIAASLFNKLTYLLTMSKTKLRRRRLLYLVKCELTRLVVVALFLAKCGEFVKSQFCHMTNFRQATFQKSLKAFLLSVDMRIVLLMPPVN